MTIKRAVIKQTMSFKIPSGKMQAMIIKTMITLTIGTDNKQSMEIRSFIVLLYIKTLKKRPWALIIYMVPRLEF